jgi:hypothetical protein
MKKSPSMGIVPMDQAYYVGFRLGDQEIGLDPHGPHQIR